MIKSEVMGGVVAVRLEGRVDVGSNAELLDELKRLVGNHLDKHVVIDLTRVEYMSSSGLSLLVRIKRDLAIENKMLKLSGLGTAVKKIFTVSGMAEHFEIFDTEAEAIEAI